MHISSGSIRSTSRHCVSEETAERLRDFRLKVGDIVLGRRGEMGRCAVVREPQSGWLCGTGSLVIRSYEGMQPDFLQLFLSSDAVIKHLTTESVGSTMVNLNQQILLDLDLAIPPSNEQARIVERLEELFADLDAGVAELKAAQRKLAQYRHSLLKAAVEGALTADWRAARARSGEPQETGADLLQRILTERRARWEAKQLAKYAEQGKTPPKGWQARYLGPIAPDVAQLPLLPEGWVWTTIDQCAIDEDGITDGPFGSNLKSEHYTESGPRVIRLQNIGDGRFLDARAHISEERYEHLRKHAVIEGDVVVAMLGEVLPRSCVIPAGVAPAIVKADCARVRLNQELMPPELAVAVLNAESTRKHVNRLVKGIGRPRVNLGHIRSIPVPLPPKAEQCRILDVLSETLESCDSQNSAIERGFSLSTAQRKNILKAAFAGQLVPQDPSDEPASVLLERIRAERAKQTGAAKPRGRKPRITA
jgi:type I restriction enzyme S subunit